MVVQLRVIESQACCAWLTRAHMCADDAHKDSQTAIIAGTVSAGVALILLISVACFCVFRARMKNSSAASAPTQGMSVCFSHDEMRECVCIINMCEICR